MVGMLNDSFAYKYSTQLYCGLCEAWKVDFIYSLKAQVFGANNMILDEGRIRMLDEIGMNWK